MTPTPQSLEQAVQVVQELTLQLSASPGKREQRLAIVNKRYISCREITPVSK